MASANDNRFVDGTALYACMPRDVEARKTKQKNAPAASDPGGERIDGPQRESDFNVDSPPLFPMGQQVSAPLFEFGFWRRHSALP